MKQDVSVQRNRKIPTNPFMSSNFMMQPIWDGGDSVFSEMMQRTMNHFLPAMATFWRPAGLNEPHIDITENGNKFIVRADVPGIEADDIEVSVADGALVISGEKREMKEANDENYLHRECFCGSFSRSIALPENADIENAEASFEQNVLSIRVPKREMAGSRKRKIDIESAQKDMARQTKKEERKSV
jgi:HSP20 family protein